MRRSVALIVTLLALTACPPRQGPPPLFTPGEELQIEDPSGALLRRIEVTIRVEALIPGRGTTLELPLPERTVEVALEPVDPEALALPPGSAAWTGTVPGGGEAFVMRIGSAIEASVQIGSRVYRLRTLEGTRGILEIFDATRLREAIDDGVVAAQIAPGAPADAACEDPSTRVDVMVLYTPAARDASGGVQAIENEIAFAVGRANLAYWNSNVAHRLNLVHTGLATYNEPSAGVASGILFGALANTNDGVLDEVRSLRDAVHADLVSLIYERDATLPEPVCGQGHFVQQADDDTDDRAFSVVRRSCAGSNLTLAHETGHNLGADHDRDSAHTSGLSFNFGHIQPVPTNPSIHPWRTVMSYDDTCRLASATNSCQRVPYFSNPNVSYAGDPTGVPLTSAAPEHNVEVLARNGAAVSRYRCLRNSGAAANVWMKDRWEDQGAEPGLVGVPMWESPYIWVRRDEDARLEHEHEHQDPLRGRTNHVYVKLHNTGGAPEVGNLEVYFASAATNLNDPASWTQIGSAPLTVARGVEVTRLRWDDLPGAGHYCLLARWNTDGSPLAFTNLAQSVRASNDLIWRNLNVQDLAADSEADHVFEMVGQSAAWWTYLVIQTEPRSSMPLPWSDLARVYLTIDERAFTNPEVPSPEATNMVPVAGSPRTYEVPLDSRTKRIGPFGLLQGERVPVVLHVSADPQQVRQSSAQLANPAEYELRVTQIRSDAADLALENPNALFGTPEVVHGGMTFHLRVPAGE